MSGSSGDAGGAGVAATASCPILAGIGDPSDEAAWTVLVYGHADHNLSNSFVRDIFEMAGAEISDEVRVIVLADFDASQESADSGRNFPSGAQWLRITGDDAEPETLGEEEELDLDDPSLLAAAIATAFNEFPSERRALILWDHGGSWMGGFGGDTQDGTRQGAPMSPPHLAEAIAAGLEAADVERLDILSFDTCLMASAEVALAMHTLTEIYIATPSRLRRRLGLQRVPHLLSSNTDTPIREIARTRWSVDGTTSTLAQRHAAALARRARRRAAACCRRRSRRRDRVASSETLTGPELGRASYFILRRT